MSMICLLDAMNPEDVFAELSNCNTMTGDARLNCRSEVRENYQFLINVQTARSRDRREESRDRREESRDRRESATFSSQLQRDADQKKRDESTLNFPGLVVDLHSAKSLSVAMIVLVSGITFSILFFRGSS